MARSLASRLERLTAVSPSCRRCTDLSSVVVIEGSAAEVADPAYVDARLPYPRRCPLCGRQVIRLIRLYTDGGQQTPRLGMGGL